MTIRFGQFDIDSAARELRIAGERRETEPKAFDLLVYLIEHRDRAVSKDELLEAIWPRQIVTETALSRAVMKARRAVDDDATRQAVIRTVHGHGYRFVMELDSSPPAAETNPSTAAQSADRAIPGKDPVLHSKPNPNSSSDPELGRRLPLTAGVLSVIALLVIAVAAGLALNDWRTARLSVDEAIAVLPVDNRVEDPDYQWVRLGLMSLLQRMLDEGGIDVVPDRRVLDALGDEALTAPPDLELAERLRQQSRADALLYTQLARDGGLYRLSVVLRDSSGKSTRRIIVGEAPAAIAADMAEVLVSLRSGTDTPDPGRFAKTSSDPFVNEMYARALDLELIGKPEEARRLFQLAAEQEPELFWLRYEIALCTRDLREWDAATEQFEALYEEARAGNDPRAAIVTLNSHGVMELQRNRYDAAEERFLSADATASEFGLPTDRAAVKVNLALIANRRGRIDEAGLHYEGALDAWEEAEVEPPPIFLNNYAGHLLRQGRLTEARGFSERAVAGFRVQGHRRYEAPSLNRLGRILRRLGDLDGSLERHRESLAIYRDLDNVRGELSATGGIVTTYRARGDLTRARMHAEDALQRAESGDDQLVLADTVMRIGQVEADAKNRAPATQHFRRALGIFEELGDEPGRFGASLALIDVALPDGDRDEAESLARRLLAEAEENQQAARVAELSIAIARLHEARDEIDRAASRYRQALDYARDANNNRLLPLAAVHLGVLELERGNVDIAQSLADEARPHALVSRDQLRLDARIMLAAGDSGGALQTLRRLRELAGEVWTADDQRLIERAEAG